MFKLAFTVVCIIFFAVTTVRAGEPFPNLKLEKNGVKQHSAYLEVTSPTPSLSDIPTPYILLYFFNVYCTNCDADMDKATALFEILDGQGLSGRIKMLGFGLNNAQFEVDFFRKTHHSPIPLFPIQNSHTKLPPDKDKHPAYLLINRTKKNTFETVFFHVGPIKEPTAFVHKILMAAGYGG